MQILSLIWGIFSILGMLVGFIPCLGAYNWINIPFAALGLVFSIIAVVNEKPGESKSSGTAGLIMCASAIIFGVFRLMLGGGVL